MGDARFMNSLLYTIAFLGIFGQLFLFSPLSGLRVSFLDCGVLIFVIQGLRTWGKTIFISIPNSWKMFFFVMVLSVVVNHAEVSIDRTILSFVYMFRALLYAFFGSILAVAVRNGKIAGKDILRALLLYTTGIVFVGFIQYLFVPDLRSFFAEGYDDHYFRAISTVLDPPFTALIAGVGAIFLLQKKNAGSLILTLAHVGLLLLTYSRSSYVAFFVTIFTLVLVYRKKLLSYGLITLLLFIVAIPFLPRRASEGTLLERTVSVNARTTIFLSSFQSITWKTAIFGKGWYLRRTLQLSENQTISHATAPDNVFVQVFEFTGAIGILVFGYALVQLLRDSFKHPEVFGAILFLCIASQMNAIFFTSIGLFFLMSLQAMSNSIQLTD
ncbi:MAG TPA: hypothetical protein DCW55_02895 [Candidatus Pacebacteria bacterium]|nr:MAG: hypothetical protein UW18_C0003G0078 [Microgenomates group bacterium GW2011_GWF1_44_10]OGJ41712.1 MAG: hypothetical protein A2378_02415 [Candidatus Pacebacteria bacterium RIFOXYB1_FULL_44_10]HAU99152.1 hypothetical protein [Candidatus Paceibacterota bacterium]HAX01682.1 hypothetical protein [Candidatus Paceibacterota bacterium]